MNLGHHAEIQMESGVKLAPNSSNGMPIEMASPSLTIFYYFKVLQNHILYRVPARNRISAHSQRKTIPKRKRDKVAGLFMGSNLKGNIFGAALNQ